MPVIDAGKELTVTDEVTPAPEQPLLSVTVTEYAPLLDTEDTLAFCVEAVNDAGPDHA